MITILRETEEQRRLTEETRKERAARRRSYWTSWRQEYKPPDDDYESEEVEVDRMTLRRETAVEMKQKRVQWKKEREEEADQEVEKGNILDL